MCFPQWHLPECAWINKNIWPFFFFLFPFTNSQSFKNSRFLCWVCVSRMEYTRVSRFGVGLRCTKVTERRTPATGTYGPARLWWDGRWQPVRSLEIHLSWGQAIAAEASVGRRKSSESADATHILPHISSILSCFTPKALRSRIIEPHQEQRNMEKWCSVSHCYT